jgi:anti-anti-sigma regulatory factor
LELSRGVVFGAPVLRVEGAVDPQDAIALERAAWEALGNTGNLVILDLEPCTHIGSAGLAVLFSLVRWARPRQGGIIAIRPSAHMLHLFWLVRLTDERGFEVFVDMDSARERIISSIQPGNDLDETVTDQA